MGNRYDRLARLVVVCTLHGCGGLHAPRAAVTASKIPAVDDGICASAAGAAESLARGCPRRALALLAGATGVEADLLRGEARADALGEGFDALSGWGSDVAPVADQPWLEPVQDPLYVLDPLMMAEDDGRLAREISASGRLARLALRAAPTPSCIGVPTPPTQMSTTWRYILAGMFQRYDRTLPGELRIAHVAAQAVHWQCSSSADLLDKLARDAAEAGYADLAIDAKLDAIELTYFPGGRALEFDLEDLANGDAVKQAAMEEAARFREGPLWNAGKAADEALAAVQAGSASQQARINILRAIAALRLRMDPAMAREHAGAAEIIARGARRADLLDQARLVVLFADIEDERWSDLERRLDLLDRSFEVRGVVGARRALANKLRAFVGVDLVSARIPRAIELATRLERVESELPPARAIVLASALPSALLASGRIEAAAEATAKLQQQLERMRNRMEPDVLAPLTAVVDTLHRAAAIADPDVLGFDNNHIEFARAFHDGDLDTLAAIRRRPVDATGALARAYMMANNGRGCRLAGLPALLRYAEGMAGFSENLTTRFRAGDTDVLSSLARSPSVSASYAVTFSYCAAVLGSAQLADLGRKLVRSSVSWAGDLDPILDGLFDAATSEANGEFRIASRSYLDLARAMVQRMGNSPEGGVTVGEASEELFWRAAASALKAGDTESAIVAFEESRARDLRVSRAMASAAPGRATVGTATDEVTAAEHALDVARARRRMLANLAARGGPEVRSVLENQAAAVEHQIEELQHRYDVAVRALMRRDHGAYERAALAPPLNARQLAERLEPDEVVVYSAIGDEEAWLILIERSSPARIVPLDPAVAPAARRYRSLLAKQFGHGRGAPSEVPDDSRPGELETARARLGMLLAQPLMVNVTAGRRLIIVPDALTSTIPFAALAGTAGLLGARHPLRVVPGGYLLSASSPPSGTPRTALVVGGVDFDTPSGAARGRGPAEGGIWASLPGARDEAAAVAKLYGVQPLGGREATEAAIRQRMVGVDVLHFATHGVADMRRPADSMLVLALPHGGESDDGFLRADEIARISIDARLVVLSACETGTGRIRGAQGVFGLDRAFLVAGAETVVSSLWVVSDAATATLMRDFHERIRRGVAADIALAEAMAVVRGDPRWRDPYYWAAFRVVGAGLRKGMN